MSNIFNPFKIMAITKLVNKFFVGHIRSCEQAKVSAGEGACAILEITRKVARSHNANNQC